MARYPVPGIVLIWLYIQPNSATAVYTYSPELSGLLVKTLAVMSRRLPAFYKRLTSKIVQSGDIWGCPEFFHPLPRSVVIKVPSSVSGIE